ncbi:MAG: NIF family HAD-type phosphatase [Candidatus Competibacterales bacterium]
MSKQLLAIDLDETLGATLTDGRAMTGFQLRKGCIELLHELKSDYRLALWSVGNRSYVDKALKYARLKRFFSVSYSWDELAVSWKDIRLIGAACLIDNSEHHYEEARQHGLEENYIIVPSFGSATDVRDPLKWVQVIRTGLSQCRSQATLL